MDYVNEHLWAGHLGRALVTLAFVAAALAAFGGVRGTNRGDGAWTRLTGAAFAVSTVSIAGVIALLLTMMTGTWYEYAYVQQHVNDDLPFRYVFTAFWEGQEGSFLLWLLWHGVLGLVVWGTNRRWRLPVVAVIASVQVVLLSMLLGVYLPFAEELRIGSSPFLLLRETMSAPIFQQADYVSLIEGTGLNPLLQNYWMIIHPPTLFLGFASTVMPFAFAVAALWTGRHKAWLQPALRWSLFSAGILGIGILMGGAWAYEALNFGGYWAWDPVENTSLVPWLLLIAGIHTNLIARATGHSIRSTYVFYLLGFVGVLYSSLLTRSGLLGETSVHAFTEMGLEAQLIFLTGVFSVMGFGLLATRWGKIPTKEKEEAVASREFWMFLGSLVLLFSAGMITASTSLPVVNKIGDALSLDIGHLTINEPVAHYNKYQLWVGVFMGLFTAIGQYLRWRGVSASARKSLVARMGIGAAVALVLGYATSSVLLVQGWHFTALAFAAYYAIIANLDYLVTSKVALWQRAGSFTAHAGFGVMLIGVLLSGLNQRQISQNTFAMEGLLDEETIGKNVLLMKGLPMVINGYEVTYLSDTLKGNRRDFAIQYRELSRDGEIGNSFVLKPYALYTNDFSKVASMNPDTKHYWDHDVFTHITGLPPGSQSAEMAKEYEDSLKFERYDLALGASTVTPNHRLTLESITDTPTHPDYEPEEGDLALGMRIRVDGLEGFVRDTSEYAEPVVVLRENLVYSYPAQLNTFEARVQVPEAAFAARYTPEEQLTYETFDVRPGQTVRAGGYDFTFAGFDRNADHPGYRAQEDDVAVVANLSATPVLPKGEQASTTLRPLYFIRGERPGDLKAMDLENGLHARLIGIDPGTGSAKLMLAVEDLADAPPFPVEIAENASRTDWIVLEATVFPGINLFWIGSIAMLLGLLISMGFRIAEKRRLAKAVVPPTESQRVRRTVRRESEPV